MCYVCTQTPHKSVPNFKVFYTCIIWHVEMATAKLLLWQMFSTHSSDHFHCLRHLQKIRLLVHQQSTCNIFVDWSTVVKTQRTERNNTSEMWPSFRTSVKFWHLRISMLWEIIIWKCWSIQCKHAQINNKHSFEPPSPNDAIFNEFRHDEKRANNILLKEFSSVESGEEKLADSATNLCRELGAYQLHGFYIKTPTLDSSSTLNNASDRIWFWLGSRHTDLSLT